MSDQPSKPSKPTRGRGAVTNHPSRFLAAVVEPQSDDWGDGLDILEHWLARSTKVQVKPDLTKRLITTNRSPDIPFEQSINPYKGCEHGCIYCFARPTHAYLCLLYTSPSPRDRQKSRMPSSA